MSAPLPGGEELGPLLYATRRLLDAVAGSVAPPAAIRAATWSVIAACESLEPFPVAEAFAAAGERPDLPGHGHPGRVPHVEVEGDDLTARGRVTFARAHLGGGGAANGGSISLLFDDLLGRQAVRRSDQSPPRRAPFSSWPNRSAPTSPMSARRHACTGTSRSGGYRLPEDQTGRAARVACSIARMGAPTRRRRGAPCARNPDRRVQVPTKSRRRRRSVVEKCLPGVTVNTVQTGADVTPMSQRLLQDDAR